MSMNNIRERKLSNQWYPEKSDQIESFINKALKKGKSKRNNKIAAIVPHAGWFFSGEIAVKTISSLISNPDIVIIVGGHLPPGSPLYTYSEDMFETALGRLNLDKDFIPKLNKEFKIKEDHFNDNTIEVLLPFIKFFFPNTDILCLRIGSGPESYKLGSLLFNISNELRRKAVIIGSTDLTHYGSNFSFVPFGQGEKALQWVKKINDKNIIDKMLSMDYKAILTESERNYSACSAGAASAAIHFAALSGITRGNLIEYSNSYEIVPSESFVGYAGISY
jgi:MEMO1 family protein